MNKIDEFVAIIREHGAHSNKAWAFLHENFHDAEFMALGIPFMKVCVGNLSGKDIRRKLICVGCLCGALGISFQAILQILLN